MHLTNKGFEILVYQFSSMESNIVEKVVVYFIACLHPLYEQKKTTSYREVGLGDYARR
jgi:hypothetical protein